MTLNTKEHLRGKWITAPPSSPNGNVESQTTTRVPMTALMWGLNLSLVYGKTTTVEDHAYTSARNQPTVCVSLTFTNNTF